MLYEISIKTGVKLFKFLYFLNNTIIQKCFFFFIILLNMYNVKNSYEKFLIF